ncbi:MAG: CopG family transcriptional regulator [Sphingobacteriaceae bacterium]|nr:CopG family transcriptional regulator [Sphingobacteriaceae bacterium]
MLAIRLPLDIETRLENLAKSTGRTKTYYAREAILEYIGDLEDVYMAQQRMEDIRSGKTKTIPFDEILKNYDLAN